VRCSKGTWGAWAGDMAGDLVVRVRWSTAVRGEGETNRAAPRRNEGGAGAKREGLGVLTKWAREAET
jgi:hypothetical protein